MRVKLSGLPAPVRYSSIGELAGATATRSPKNRVEFAKLESLASEFAELPPRCRWQLTRCSSANQISLYRFSAKQARAVKPHSFYKRVRHLTSLKNKLPERSWAYSREARVRVAKPLIWHRPGLIVRTCPRDDWARSAYAHRK